MTDRQLRDEAMTILLAGHETTAVALAWTFYLLSQNPQAESVLHEELDSVLRGAPPTAGDVKRAQRALTLLVSVSRTRAGQLAHLLLGCLALTIDLRLSPAHPLRDVAADRAFHLADQLVVLRGRLRVSRRGSAGGAGLRLQRRGAAGR